MRTSCGGTASTLLEAPRHALSPTKNFASSIFKLTSKLQTCTPLPESQSSYRQLLKATSLIGGAQGINLLLGMVRVKFAALLIGPHGVGLSGSFTTIQGLVSSVANLGIHSGAIREIAQAHASCHDARMAALAKALRRLCLVTGLIGAAALAAISPWLSEWTFGSNAHGVDVAILAIAVLFVALQAASTALLQGSRHVADVARVSIVGSISSTVLSIPAYYFFGVDGIAPVIALNALVVFAASSWRARNIGRSAEKHSWSESLRVLAPAIKLGLVFVWTGLLATAVTYMVQTIIIGRYGLAGVGLFTAAFALSSMFSNFVLSSMESDFYPRLAAAAPDSAKLCQTINHQIEIGLLLALPGVLGTLVFAPWLLHVFYSKEFVDSAPLLTWFVLGNLLRFVCEPIAYLLLALDKRRWAMINVTSSSAVRLFLSWVCLLKFGLVGAAVAHFALYSLYSLAMVLVGRYLVDFKFSNPVRRLLVAVCLTVLLFLLLSFLDSSPSIEMVRAVLFAFVALACGRALVRRVGLADRFATRLLKARFVRAILGAEDKT